MEMQMEVEWLILADAAQVLGNKLYLLGGGWDRVSANSPFPINHRMALALAIKVPWNETNQKHVFEVEIISEDHETEEPRSLMKMGGQFEVGRPPGLRQGQAQRIQLALDMTLKIDTAGTKTVIATIDGQRMRTIDFAVTSTLMTPTVKPDA